MNKWTALACAFLFPVSGAAQAALYQVAPTEFMVAPNSTTSVAVSVLTQPGDNTVGVGFFSFAIDLGFTGTAGVQGSDVSNVQINTLQFDDVDSNQTGSALGSSYLGVGGVTSHVIAPTFGHNVGDVTALFTFDLQIPASAEPGEVIIITPTEGFLESLIVDDAFSKVAPQNFQPVTIVIVPEPAAALLLFAGGALYRKGR